MAAENSDTLKLKDNLIPGGKVLYEMRGVLVGSIRETNLGVVRALA